MIMNKMCAGNDLLAIISEKLEDVNNECTILGDKMEAVKDKDDMASIIEQDRIVRRAEDLKEIAHLYEVVAGTINNECTKGFNPEELLRTLFGM